MSHAAEPYYRSDRRNGRGYRDDYRRRDFDRDDRRRRRRSRSRSRSAEPQPFTRRRLDLSTSRERSRERERRRRKQQAECIRRAGGFKKLADSEGREPVRLFWDGFQWVAKTGASQSALLSDPILVNSTRKLRRLYFGNLPLHLGLTETNFQLIVYQEMKKRGFCNNPDENPVLCVWFAKDKGNYGFVEFASVEETERALTMDGMDCLGVAIKVSRPNDYCNATNQQQSAAMNLLGQHAGQLLAGAIPNLPTSQLVQSIVGNLGHSSAIIDYPDSKVVCLKGIVTPSDVDSADEYAEILEDIKEGCEQCGKIIASVLVSPALMKVESSLEAGDVYLEFDTVTNAQTCLSVMSERKYFDRPIRAVRCPADTLSARLAAYTAKNGLVVEETLTKEDASNGRYSLEEPFVDLRDQIAF